MFLSSLPLFVALATFANYAMLGNTLDVASALPSFALFDILRFPLFMLPQVINNLVEANVSFERVREYLISEDHIPVGEGSIGKGNDGGDADVDARNTVLPLVWILTMRPLSTTVKSPRLT